MVSGGKKNVMKVTSPSSFSIVFTTQLTTLALTDTEHTEILLY
jgi:hypothetical protein